LYFVGPPSEDMTASRRAAITSGAEALYTYGEVNYKDAFGEPRFGELILLSVPWAAVPEALKAAGDFEGKTLFSCVNCLKADFNGLEVGISTAWFPPAILSPT
jgi:predicted dinucleotide-binding enzyme